MRELIPDMSPSLFDAPPPASYLHAKDFVRWCCSFGPDFHNSPDRINLRYWVQEKKITLKDTDEADILSTAGSLFLKWIEQSARGPGRTEKSEAPN